MIKRLYKNSFDKRNYWETSEIYCVMTTQLKIGSINILRLVLTVAADRFYPDKDHGYVSAANCYLKGE